VEDLADLFRANIGAVRNLATFDEEFELVRGHLNIETLRLGSRLNTVWEPDTIPDSARSKKSSASVSFAVIETHLLPFNTSPV
jgi:LytS/YehU family sensor histidine kinase